MVVTWDDAADVWWGILRFSATASFSAQLRRKGLSISRQKKRFLWGRSERLYQRTTVSLFNRVSGEYDIDPLKPTPDDPPSAHPSRTDIMGSFQDSNVLHDT